jgi:putative NADPH-quinone reductase
MQVLVVLAHPNEDSLNHAIASRACAALRSCGHEVHLLDLYALSFRAAMSPEERSAYHSDAPIVDDMVAEHAALLSSAEALVFIYPTWWSGLPAILKGWVERVCVPGVGFKFNAAGKVRPGLTHVRHLVGISTYGSPRLYVKLVNDNGRRTILRTVRLNTGWRTRTKWFPLYEVDTSTASQREAFMATVERGMRSL